MRLIENLGTSLIPMDIPVRSHLEGEAVLTYPQEPSKCKEHVIIKTAREFGVMPSESIETVLGA